MKFNVKVAQSFTSSSSCGAHLSVHRKLAWPCCCVVINSDSNFGIRHNFFYWFAFTSVDFACRDVMSIVMMHLVGVLEVKKTSWALAICQRLTFCHVLATKAAYHFLLSTAVELPLTIVDMELQIIHGLSYTRMYSTVQNTVRSVFALIAGDNNEGFEHDRHFLAWYIANRPKNKKIHMTNREPVREPGHVRKRRTV